MNPSLAFYEIMVGNMQYPIEVKEEDIRKARNLSILLFIGGVVQIIVMVTIFWILSSGGGFQSSGGSGTNLSAPFIFTLFGLMNLTLIVAAVMVYLRVSYLGALILLFISVVTAFPLGTIFAIIGLFMLPKARKAFPGQLKKMIERGDVRGKPNRDINEPIKFLEKEKIKFIPSTRRKQHPDISERNVYKSSYRAHLSKTPCNPVSSSVKHTLPYCIIKSKIGSGSSATVYEAIDKDGYKVAIKLPKFLDETLDASIYDKFESEAKMWRNLEHRNIVKLYESGLNPLPFLAMELAERGNLKQLMARYELTMGDVTNIMLQILEGMAYAHKMATVHRDLKPENILFTQGGTVKISDWGIGKFMASEGATKTVGTKGTLLYSAPEQISKKKFGKVDWSTDVFQLGIIFHEMLTGENPFYDEDSAGIVGKVLYEDVARPSELNPDISGELDNYVMKALEKQKEDRWSSAEVMYHELKKLVSGEER